MENKHPFFSIVIPTWNRADMIAKTLESVFAQTFADFEVIVVDDGSTDNTKDVVESFTDTRLQYIWQQNAERAAARNNGTRHAQGHYITFLDSDDLFKPEHLQVVYNNLEKNDFPEFFHQSYQIEDVNGNNLPYLLKVGNNPMKSLLCKGNFLSCSGVFLKKEIALNNLFNEKRELSGSEDYELWLRISLNHTLTIGLDKTSVMINHENRGEIKINKEKLILRVALLIDIAMQNSEFVLKHKRYIKSFKASNYSFISLHLALHKEKKTASKYLMKSLSCNPLFFFTKRVMIIVNVLIFR